jgi:phosphoglycolate phosphatase
MKNHFVLFDLDGTITDSSEGIINSIQFALNKMGLHENDKEKLRSYVGPSLKQTFLSNYFPDGDKYQEAITHYRAYYAEKGIFENKLYDGMTEVLEEIKNNEGTIALSTAKPTYFAKIILKYFSIDKYFDVVVGSHLGGTRTDKKDIIFETLDQLGLPDPKNCYMIGDREHDIIGAKHHNLKTIGVKYGYAPRGELEAVKPTEIVSKPLEIINAIQ